MKQENKQLHTFSYIPPNDFKDYTPKNSLPDERPFIKSTVEYVGGIKDHYLDFKGKNSFSEVDDFLEMLEMPYKYFENSFWIKGMFETVKDEGIGILLTGGRGNLTISWGSELDYYAILLKQFKWFKLYQEIDQYSKNVGGPRLRRLPDVARIAFPLMNKMFPSGTPFSFPALINPEFAKRTGVYDKLKDYGMDETGWLSSTNVYEQRKRHFEDVFHWNASNTLTAKLSLKYSLWERDPTNDLRVIRFCLSLPEEQYVQNGLDRALVRRSTKNLLPDKVRLNQRIYGVQGADWVHRMMPHWDTFVNELQQLSTDHNLLQYLDGQMIKRAIVKFSNGARPEYAMDSECRVLMRSLIMYRFIKKFT
jgi:asparagine synthase (glutamine-hydrolysing)